MSSPKSQIGRTSGLRLPVIAHSSRPRRSAGSCSQHPRASPAPSTPEACTDGWLGPSTFRAAEPLGLACAAPRTGVSGAARGTGGSRAASEHPQGAEAAWHFRARDTDPPQPAGQSTAAMSLHSRCLRLTMSLTTGAFSLKFCLLQSYHYTNNCGFRRR